MKFIFGMLLVVGLCGCGHNVLTYTSGKRLNVGINPQTQEAGFQYLDAEQISVIERDNATLTVELRDAIDENGKQTTKIAKIIYEIKEQISGADVELETAKK
jgi:hypothetical protein